MSEPKIIWSATLFGGYECNFGVFSNKKDAEDFAKLQSLKPNEDDFYNEYSVKEIMLYEGSHPDVTTDSLEKAQKEYDADMIKKEEAYRRRLANETPLQKQMREWSNHFSSQLVRKMLKPTLLPKSEDQQPDLANQDERISLKDL